MTAPELDPEFRNLIDARLDAVERALLRVQLPYSERRHIASEVEAQIYELLARRRENPTREDVIDVLDSLDPPEAYIPEELRGRPAEVTAAPVPAKSRGPRLSKKAVASVLLVLLLWYVASFGVWCRFHRAGPGVIRASSACVWPYYPMFWLFDYGPPPVRSAVRTYVIWCLT